ncbi:MAG: permease [Desulfopila sp.]
MEISTELVKDTLSFFAFTMVELAVLFVGISFLVGVINEFLPQDKVKRLLSGKGGRGYIIGSFFGGLTPFCSCSTIPVTVGLLRAQAGFGPTMAFLFTSPLVNPIIIPLFFTLLGFQVTLIYTLVAIGLAITISYFLEKTGFATYIKQDVIGGSPPATPSIHVNKDQEGCCTPGSKPLQTVPLQSVMPCCATGDQTQVQPVVVGGGSGTFVLPIAADNVMNQPNRWKRILHDAVSQFRRLMPFIILGVAIGSIIHGFLPSDLVVKLAGADNPLAVPVSALIGIPLYLRASTMVPIAASLMAKGMSTGAVIALIIGGAGASLPEVAMLKGIFKLPLLIAFLASVMVMAVSAGFLVNFVMA